MQIGFNAPTSGPLIDPDSLTRIIIEGEGSASTMLLSGTTLWSLEISSRNIRTRTPDIFPAGTQAAWLEQLATTAYIAALTKNMRFVLSVMVMPPGRPS
jgi:hypothetical protein